MVDKPQDTGCTSIELPNEGVANGIVSMLNDYYYIEYDAEEDVYRVDV